MLSVKLRRLPQSDDGILWHAVVDKLPAVCRAFQASGPFWGRHYVFWHNGKPLTLIYEVFSTALEQYLGPCGHQH